MSKEEDRHLGVRQCFYMSDFENAMVKDAMASINCQNRSQFIRDAIGSYVMRIKLGEEVALAKVTTSAKCELNKKGNRT